MTQKPKGVYVHNCRFAGKRCRVKLSDFIPEELQLIIEMNQSKDQYGLQIKNVKGEFFPYLRDMFPQEFTTVHQLRMSDSESVRILMDRVEDAVLSYTKTESYRLKSDEWMEGFDYALELMQNEMFEIDMDVKEDRNADKG